MHRASNLLFSRGVLFNCLPVFIITSKMRGDGMERQFGEYRISTDKRLLNVERICQLLSNSYWANQRATDVIRKSIENSVCFGIYREAEQIGFARVVTDHATVFYLCDVIYRRSAPAEGAGEEAGRLYH